MEVSLKQGVIGMKKLAAILLCGTLLFSNTVTPQAATVTEVVTELNQMLGVDPSDLVAYLQTIKITESQKNQLNGYISQAKGLIAGTSNLSDLSDSARTQLISIARQAGAILGLTVEIAKVGDANLTTATISANGRSLLTVNSQDVMHVTTNIDAYLTQIEEVVADLFETDVITVVPDNNNNNNNNNSGSNNNNSTNNSNNNSNNQTDSSTGTFQPYPGELKPTGMAVSAYAVSGLVLAGAGVALSRKSK